MQSVQISKLLSKLLLLILIISIASCVPNKKIINNSIVTHDEIQKNSTDEKIILKIQELRKNNTIYFGLDKYNIIYEFAKILDEHAVFLSNNPSFKVIIEGHADERGTPEYNIALGERRANSVKMYLQIRGVLNNQIKIVSYGKEKPVVSEHNEEAYAKNRRAVLVYLNN
ncbi:peptidoglycan-associated lipoprotein Pal [Blochmannia endosymbiont of Colobopsis nipponica]|uniref:peptidoglycan-associated lipoprotein Pal n=1 Tax=Blochmannia endosymbiont of Colobopsis nipponica TaxID=2681987 RepID=UPI001783B8EF|nr:peptidoglycan-associated lipoprotein Pal [Blochmannia endosymbiont of Colobopsis nipponica]QOI11105.1 peptidoglycan-associated lipoprotein Pal [Blochmannia endosymbiont of Colobopsis nipponica]